MISFSLICFLFKKKQENYQKLSFFFGAVLIDVTLRVAVQEIAIVCDKEVRGGKKKSDIIHFG